MPSHPASCRRGFAKHLPTEQHRTNPGDVRTVSTHAGGPARAAQDCRDAEVESRGFARHLPAEQHRTNPADVRTVSIHPGCPHVPRRIAGMRRWRTWQA